MIYSVPFSISFLGAVADYLLNQISRFPLSEWTIYLPTRRACNCLETTLFEKAHQKALILPRILSLGDIEPEEISLKSLHGAEEIGLLPSIISKHRRRLLLASLIEQFQYGEQAIPFYQALVWAERLMELIDELRTEGVDLKSLKNIAPSTGQAEHWEKIHTFLTLVGDHWEDILKEEKCVESISWQKRLMEIQTNLLEKKYSEAPVMVAGSLGTIPSTIRLMRVVSRLKNGVIILPGLEKRVPDHTFSIRHPQFFLSRLLEKLEIPIDEVEELRQEGKQTFSFLERIFDPSFLKEKEEASPISNIEYVEASDQGEEARLIGIAIRKAKEERKKRIVCISADQQLLCRVSEELQFWGLSTKAMPSKTLLETKIGSFLHLMSLWFSPSFPAVAMASTFKHSFLKEKSEVWTLFERHLLRTWGGHLSLAAIGNALERKQTDLPKEVVDRLMVFYTSLKDYLAHMKGGRSLGDYLEKMELLISLILESDKKIEDLFSSLSSEEGPIFQELWADLKKSSGVIITQPQDMSHILLNLLKGHKIPSGDQENNNIFLLSPLEARFVEADFKILAGVNEGIWPAEPIADPFFSASMRQMLNLPSLEGRISQSAHDFLSCICGAEAILITRSLRVGGIPSVPSRFLSYLETAFRRRNLEFPQNKELKEWARTLMSSSRKGSLKAPRPAPPVSYRPKRLSLTDISLLINDPYSVYAKYILRLKKLESLELENKPRLFGIFVHHFLHRWRSIHPHSLEDLFLGQARFLFELYLGPVDQSRFWWEKFLILLKWLEQQKSLQNSATEVKGEFSFGVGEECFTIFGRADRIDWDNEAAVLIDYKTGTTPSLSDIRSGKAPQLLLEALIFLKGRFTGVPRVPLKSLQYWGLLSQEIICMEKDLTAVVENTQQNLEQLVRSFYKATTPYLSHPKGFIKTGEYDHLSRIQEWYVSR